jgi:hypothetical protein
MHPPGCHTGLEAVFTNSIFSTFLGGSVFALPSPSYIYILYIKYKMFHHQKYFNNNSITAGQPGRR